MSSEDRILKWAIEREDWEAAALCIVISAVRVATKVPVEALDEMVVLLAEGTGFDDEVGGRGGRRGG